MIGGSCIQMASQSLTVAAVHVKVTPPQGAPPWVRMDTRGPAEVVAQ